MKSRITICLLLLAGLSSKAQLMNNGSVIHMDQNSLVSIRGSDLHNHGYIFHQGHLHVDNHVVNRGQFACDSLGSSRIDFGGNWTNDSSFSPGIGTVNMIGDNQVIGGFSESNYFTLNLLGQKLAVKSLENNIGVAGLLDLKNAELATNQSSATMQLGSKEIVRQDGFVSTKIDGRLNREFTHQRNIYSSFPLGHNKNGKVILKPIVVNRTDSGTFRTAFIYENAANYDMYTSQLDDSLCTVNEEYFHIAGASPGAQTTFGIIGADEYSWSRLASWEGPWTKVPNSSHREFQGASTFGTNYYFGVSQYELEKDKPLVLATEKPFVHIEDEVVYVAFNDFYEIKPEYYRPENSSISWTPPDHLSCDDCPDPVYSAGLPNVYTVEIDNNFGCVAMDTIRIQVVRGEGNPTLIPNAFSPNNDGLNDLFLPHLYSFEELVNMSIYNRWGQKIYEGVDGWDGTFMGKPVQMGSYLYKIEIRELIKNGYHRNIHLSGILTIVR